jgi:hypothetical protein
MSNKKIKIFLKKIEKFEKIVIITKFKEKNIKKDSR